MSEESSPSDLWDIADEVIEVANRKAKETAIDTVSLSLLWAAARYNAFNVAKSVRTKDELMETREKAMDHFMEQYKTMLSEHLDEYINNYDEYMKG